jgi:hypothetical protein
MSQIGPKRTSEGQPMAKANRILIWSLAAVGISALAYVAFIVAANIGVDVALH